MLLGIYVHATHSFFVPMWSGVQDVTSSVFLIVSYFFFHYFRLHTFFLVAGFFAHMVYHRDGPIRMLKVRAVRILVPFLLGLITVVPLMYTVQIYGEARAVSRYALIPWDRIADYLIHGELLQAITPHYLWFLYYLMMYYVIFVALRPLLTKVDHGGGIRKRADRFIAFLCRSRWAPAVMTVPTFGAMLLMTMGPMIDEPGFSFWPLPGPLLLYGLFFWVGWMLHRHPEHLESLKNRWISHLIGGVIMFVFAAGAAMALFAYFSQQEQPSLENVPAQIALLFQVVRFVTSYVMWSLTLSMVGIFVRFFQRQRPFFRYIADSSYWLYVAHVPLLIYIQIQVVYWQIPWYVKIVFILVLLNYILLLAYHFLVRSTFLGALLNGRIYPLRFPWFSEMPKLIQGGKKV